MANTTIKITQLQNIGNGLAANTLLPVVNTAGTAITQKVTVGNVANFALSQAGNTLAPAFLANVAYSVVNAAQPNITSVGTLNVNTLKISGGTNGYVLQTDGAGNLAWTAQTGNGGNGSPGGSNSQLQFNLNGSFAGDTDLTWDAANNKINTVNLSASGNISAANINVTGNIRPNAIYTDHYYYANGDVFGGGGGNGTPGGSNTQIQFNDAGAFAGNTGFTFNKTTGILTSPFLAGNGNGLSNIQGANVSGAVNLATFAGTANGVAGSNVSGAVNLATFAGTANAVAGSNVTGAVSLATFAGTANSVAGGNVTGQVNFAATANSVAGANVSGQVSFAGTANSVAVANVVGLGNIATVSLNGNGNQYLRGNGTWGNATANLGNLAIDNYNIYNTTGQGVIISNFNFLSEEAETAYVQIPAGNSSSDLSVVQEQGNVRLVANTAAWNFDTSGNLTLPNNTFAIKYANGTQVPLGGGNASALVNDGNAFVLDADGSVTFEGADPGEGVNRGLEWDYGANANGVNSMVRQDINGVTVRAWTEQGGGANGFSAPVNIVTNQDATENRWVFSGQGNLTLPGNLNIPTGNIVSNIVSPAFTSGITSIDVTGNANVTITVSDELFDGETSGQVTISDVNAPVQANGDWWYLSTDFDQFQLYTDANLTTPVDGSSWPGYAGPGGTAVGVGTYSNLTIQGGNISVRSNDKAWIFDTTGNLTIPNDILSNTTIDIDNRLSGNTADIRLYSADDIVLQGRDRSVGSGTEGGDINIYAGDSAEDGDASGGDIQIFAGTGGDANIDFGGQGGFITIRAGQGGSAIGDGVSVAESGGSLTLEAGDAGGNNGNVDRGADGGDVYINAGESTGNLDAGGDIVLTTGPGGSNAPAGNVRIIIPSSDVGAGGTWTFGHKGNLTLPNNSNIDGADGQFARFQSIQEGVVRSGMILNPGDGLTRLESWDNETSQSFTSADWSSAQYVDGGPAGQIAFVNAPSILNLVNSIETSRLFLQVNGGSFMPYQGYGSSGNNITFDVLTAPANSPETVTNFTMSWSTRSRIEMDYDEGELNITARNLDININGDQDVDLQSSYRVRIENSSNVNGIYISTDTANTFRTWTFDVDGSLAFPDGSNISGGNFNAGSPSASVALNAFSPSGDTVSVQAQGNTSSAVISIFSNAGPVTSNWTFTTAPLDPGESFLYIPNGGAISTPDATGGEGGKNIFIQAGSSDPVTWNSNPGGELMLKGGYGSFGDGGGGPGGDVNIEGGLSSDSHAGNVNISSGLNTWVFDYTGNLTLPANTFSVNYANGTPVSIGGSGNTGNVTFDNVTVQGVNGLNLSAGSDFTANLAYLQVRAGDVASHIHLDTGNNQAYDLIVGDDQNYVQVSSTGNILLSSYDSNTAQYTWTLDYNGNLILAGGNSVIQSIANSSLDPTLSNVSTMVLTPDPNYSSQALVLDPTSVGHIHLRAPSASSNIDDPSANLFLGGEASSFEVGIGYGSAPNVYVHSNNNTWTFDTTGNLTVPGNLVAASASPAPIISGFSSANFAGTVTANNFVTSGSGGNITGANVISANTVTANGNITANNFVTSGSGGNISGANVISANTVTATGNVSAGAFIGEGGNISNIQGSNVSGQVSYAATANSVALANVSGIGNIASINLTGSSSDVLYGNGVFAPAAGGSSNIANGNSNVNIATANGNVTIAAVGNTVMTITGTGANITGTANITGNLVAGNIIGTFANGNSNVTIATAAGNVVTNVTGQTILTVYTGGIKVGGSGIIQSPGGAQAITLNNNGANLPIANITNTLNVTGAAGANITANLTAGNISTAGNITGNTNGFAIGYLNIPQVGASNTTLALTDAGKHYYSTTAGNITLTIPLNSSVAFPTGAAISIVVQAAGNILVNAASGVTLYMAGNSVVANRVVGSYGMATLMKVASDTWFINGTGVS